VSGTLGFVEPTQYLQAGNLNFGNFGTANSTGQNDTGGTSIPDIVGNLKVTQAWGEAQLSVAAHNNRTGYYFNNNNGSFNGHPNDAWGYAVQGGITINNIPTGAGDTINASVVYTNGATRYNIQDLAAGNGAWTSYASTSVPGAIGSVGIGVAPDSVFNNNGSQSLISTWGGRGGFNHNWNPYWSSSLYGAYAAVSYGSTTSAGSAASTYCASFLASQAGAGNVALTCNPNYSVGQVGFITRWTPVKNLTFSADFTWSHLNQNMTGVVVLANSNGQPAGAYAFANQNTYNALFRAQRNF